jgi:hypothetical protein
MDTAFLSPGYGAPGRHFKPKEKADFQKIKATGYT